jgi:putative transposon-encoded protein
MSSIAKRGLSVIYAKLVKPFGSLSVRVGIGAGLYLYFDQNVGCVRYIAGPSMKPAINPQLNDEHILMKRDGDPLISGEDLVYFSRNIQKLERGDIVLIQRPNRDDSSRLAKRVVAVEGDIITPFGVGATVRSPVEVAAGDVWVESDAGPGYLGSSVFGPVQVNKIQGIAKAAFGSTHEILFNFRYLTREIPGHVKPNLVENQAIPAVKETATAF